MAFIIFNLLGRDDLVKARYLLPYSPLFFMIIGNSILKLKKDVIKALVIFFIVTLSMINFYLNMNVDDEFKTSETAYKIIKRMYRDGDLVVVEPPLIGDIFLLLPSNCKYITIRQREPFGAFSSQYTFSKKTTISKLKKEIQRYKRVIYYLYPYSNLPEKTNQFLNYLKTKMTETKKIGVISSTIYVFERKKN
jgi:hypothetical protein